jgi:hypothetical protein
MVFGVLRSSNDDAMNDDSLSELGHTPDPNMGLNVLGSSPQVPADFKRLFGLEFAHHPLTSSDKCYI